jgi:MICAL-like protein 1
MAHVVPKREPCRKCNNPVFLAERLVINQTLYHRTCFRCARCNTILSVGYFYETEKDHEFCCEQCPDEEKPAGPKVESNRLSIAQKIALFEKESSSVLRKSLSDEKSKSLKRQSPANSSAFNSFMATQITEAKAESTDDDDEKTIASTDTDSDDDAISDKKMKISDQKSVPVTKELTLGTAIAQKPSESQAVAKDNALVDKKVEKVPDEFDEIEMEFDKLVEEAEKSISFDVPDVKTKEKNKKIVENVQKIEEKIEKSQEIPEENIVEIERNVVEQEKKNVDLEGKVEGVEENVENLEEKSGKVQSSDESSKIVEEEKTIEIPKIQVREASLDENVEIAGDSSEAGTQEVSEVPETSGVPVIDVKATEVDGTPSKVDEHRSSEGNESSVEAAKSCHDVESPPEVAVILDDPSSFVDKIEEKPTEEPETSPEKPETPQEKLPDPPQEEESYPDDLNPFGDDDEPPTAPQPSKKPSLNPFGSCSEDEDEKENEKPSAKSFGTLPKPPRPPPPKATTRASMNPFGSEDEEEEEQKPVAPHKTPVPTPRKMAM